ncbi:cytochrome P450 [Gloeophyllum trabeum ATCC 11539]|uniref:Cytochrome P450 n=1 Tax=Gloeophyllum trabeum (strain ATCC 11539 / FP-39264 / Madison 617) TaxID=670483 RepID=S7RMY0_GLOTA|nr:cytochrome P450 [Gloeophyllum trabeum ATCC 11539]EPQ55820.1 cytochrome P450 [Gloeophyllum trabeum ATCC 11539]
MDSATFAPRGLLASAASTLASPYVLLTLIVVGALVIRALWRPGPLDGIPTIGPSGPLTSYVGALQFMFRGRDMIQEGYERYYGGWFKVPILDRWMVVVSGKKLSEELRAAPDDIFSLDQALVDMLHLDFVFGTKVYLNPIHTTLIQTKMTKSIQALTPELHDECVLAFEQHMPLTDSKEWTAIPCLETGRQLSTRINNRILVGAPLCRDQEYINLNLRFIVDMFQCRLLLCLFPRFLHGIVGRLFTNINTQIRTGMRLLKPVLDERVKALEDADGEWSSQPNDMLSWLIASVPKDETLDTMTRRMLGVNVAAIHTISHTFTHSCYYLAANQQYIAPIRKEVEEAIAEEGWTKAAFGKMYLLDSFLREVLRLNGAQAWSLNRIALKDYTFSDGTFIPKGTNIAATSHPVHTDPSVYKNPDDFDPFRFARAAKEDGAASKHLLVTTSLDYLPFGHGSHACPGRFFAANQLKLMIGHLLLNYDIQLEQPGVVPRQIWFEAAVLPHQTAKLLYRKRQT